MFAFGKPSAVAAEQLELGTGRDLAVVWDTPSRRVRLFDLPSGQQLVVSHQVGYAAARARQDREYKAPVALARTIDGVGFPRTVAGPGHHPRA